MKKKIISNRGLVHLILLVLGSVFGFCHAEPTRVIRVTPEFSDWIKESDAIVKCYRENLNPPVESKIVPLFVCVQLGLGEPISESVASIHEVAFVYSEVRLKNGTEERKIHVFVRSPYEDRKWKWEPLLKITETKDSLYGFRLLEGSVDIHKQISNYANKVTAPDNSSEHIIFMIVFDKAVASLFGKSLEDDALLQMIFQHKAESKK